METPENFYDDQSDTDEDKSEQYEENVESKYEDNKYICKITEPDCPREDNTSSIDDN